MRKIRFVFALLCTFVVIPSMSQSALYVHLHDGTVRQFVYSEIQSMEYSMVDIDGTEYPDYVVQEIHTADSISRIPLALIDSVCFIAPDPEHSLSEAYVPIDWMTTEVLSCNPETGRYELLFNGEMPAIKEESVIILDCDTVSYVVLVTGVNTDGNHCEIEGEQGDLSYVFFDTEFTLSTDPPDSTSTLYGHLYRPSFATGKESIERNKKGNDVGVRATGTLWSNNGEENTTDIYKSENVHAYSKSKFALNLDYEMTMRFGDKQEVERQGRKFFSARNFYVDSNIKGNMDAYYDIFIDMENSGEIDLAPGEKDKYVLLKHKLFPTIPLKFAIGPVPVKIEMGADLYADVSLKGSGEFHFNTGIGADASLKIGSQYEGKNDSAPQMYYQQAFNVNPHSPIISGKGTLSGKVHLFPRIHAWLYGWAGPSFDIKPFLKADLSGGFQKDLLKDAPADYCAWSFKTFCGLDLAVGLSRSYYNYEVWNKSTDNLTVFEHNLYESPVDIKFRSATPDDISKGKPTEVKFEIYDRGFDGRNVLTILPQLTRFEGEGDIISTEGEYGIAKSGVVSALWTPTSSCDVLYARLYDIDGQVIAEDEYKKSQTFCSDTNHPHLVDLGLPSGTKWACCNVGAPSPEEYGGYYAWGETEEKPVYNWRTYIHCDGSERTCRDLGSNISGSDYDAAHEIWGDSWCMPTKEQFEELLTHCTHEWTSFNGISGIKFTSNVNGNSIFLPAAGDRYDTSYYDCGSRGYYWTGNYYPEDSRFAYYLDFGDGDENLIRYGYRYYGHSIRPVAVTPQE